jgi:hypothetical protein
MGKLGMINVANSAQLSPIADAEVILVVDSDGSLEGTTRLFQERLWYSTQQVIVVDPTIESWILPGVREPVRRLEETIAETGQPRKQVLLSLLEAVDLKQLARRDRTFNEFVSLLIR